jgi:hypothetical protein
MFSCSASERGVSLVCSSERIDHGLAALFSSSETAGVMGVPAGVMLVVYVAGLALIVLLAASVLGSVTPSSIRLRLLRLCRERKKMNAARRMAPPNPTPTPIPTFEPSLRPL